MGATLPAMNVSLTDEQLRFIRQRVKTGRYRTAAEVVREALRALMQQASDEQREFATWRETVRRQVEEGYAQAERGQLVDGEKAFARQRKQATTRRKRRA
jgi:antitoxin ParD1/3/4